MGNAGFYIINRIAKGLETRVEGWDSECRVIIPTLFCFRQPKKNGGLNKLNKVLGYIIVYIHSKVSSEMVLPSIQTPSGSSL